MHQVWPHEPGLIVLGYQNGHGSGALYISKQADISILTCSTANDVELFALLARSVDEHVSQNIKHLVVVPASDVSQFKRFATPQRDILIQEDVLPHRLFKLPNALKHLSPLKQGLRRPVYINKNLTRVRGWIVQQVLKIEMARHSTAKALLHVDSDVFFFRPLITKDVFPNGKPMFFGTGGPTQNPLHKVWISSAETLLGITATPDHARHYVENVVPWSTDMTRQMVARIESVHSRPWHEVLLAQKTLSEYYIYGLFIDYLSDQEQVTPVEQSLCHSFWPEGDTINNEVLDQHISGLNDQAVAFAAQSTLPFPIENRRDVYERLCKGTLNLAS